MGIKTWQDTVMSDETFKRWCQKHCKYENGECNVSTSCAVCNRKAQAEISFSLGEKQGYKHGKKEVKNDYTQSH